MWIVNVKKRGDNYAHVWLLEARRLKNGAMISTGRQTPKFSFDLLRGSFDKLSERLERSIGILVAESILAADDETLLIAAELAELLQEAIQDAEAESGGDDGGEMG